MKTPLYTLEARVNGRWKLLAGIPEFPQMDTWDNLVALWQDLRYNSRLSQRTVGYSRRMPGSLTSGLGRGPPSTGGYAGMVLTSPRPHCTMRISG